MDIKLLATVFATVFLAELGDKTQLATVLFASQGERSLWTVFLGAASALVLSAALGVVAGQWLSEVVSPRILAYVAGVGFILVGVWTLLGAWQMSS